MRVFVVAAISFNEGCCAKGVELFNKEGDDDDGFVGLIKGLLTTETGKKLKDYYTTDYSRYFTVIGRLLS